MEHDREEQIRKRAYEIWEREGRKEGSHEDHWEQAERELSDEQTGGAGGSGERAGGEQPAAPAAGGSDASRESQSGGGGSSTAPGKGTGSSAQ